MGNPTTSAAPRGARRSRRLGLSGLMAACGGSDSPRSSSATTATGDADGVYSGFGDAAPETRYLRGHQKAGDDGVADFLTIFPGWYGGRTPHVHLKVNVGGNTVHTGQVFFDEQVTAEVYKSEPYSAHGEADTSHSADASTPRPAGHERRCG